MNEIKIGIIGGSGLDEILKDARDTEVNTPFGTADISKGYVDGNEIFFISRHGKDHRINPSEVNSRANIFALKKLGVSHIIATSAVGSLREDMKPLDVVIPNQIFDRTKRRATTFFEDIAVHISFTDPFCPKLVDVIARVAVEKGYRTHDKGTYVCIEGPQFSTRAESLMYRQMGFDIIGMTALPEAKLAREAEICYATVATVTDYDVWRDEEVSAEMILSNIAKNAETVKDILCGVIPRIDWDDCGCRNALADAIATKKIPKKISEKLSILINKYGL